MDALAELISSELSQKESCTICNAEITGVWPHGAKNPEMRDAAIHAFAKNNGWTAEIIDPGIQVIFTKAPGTEVKPTPTPEEEGTKCDICGKPLSPADEETIYRRLEGGAFKAFCSAQCHAVFCAT